MSREILKISKTIMKEPVKILEKSEKSVLDDTNQYFIAIDKEEWKFDTLVELYKNIGNNFLA